MPDEPIPPGFEFLANRFDKAVGDLRGELRAFADLARAQHPAVAATG
jgi:hypothetical protein